MASSLKPFQDNNENNIQLANYFKTGKIFGFARTIIFKPYKRKMLKNYGAFFKDTLS